MVLAAEHAYREALAWLLLLFDGGAVLCCAQMVEHPCANGCRHVHYSFLQSWPYVSCTTARVRAPGMNCV
jgi:hypothetical protein